MALKDILVHVGYSKNRGAVLDCAAGFAVAHGAHLAGLHVAERPEIQGYIRAYLPKNIDEIQDRQFAKFAAEAEAAFDTAVERAGLREHSEWRAVEGPHSQTVTLHARYADLTVVAQGEPGQDDPETERLPGEVALQAGRPVLVVPYAGSFEVLGRRVMVAWNGSREAVRAVNDALPILKQAERVRVLAINPRSGPSGLGDVPGADIALHLARHGVKAEVDHVRVDSPGAEPMLELARGRPDTRVAHVTAEDMPAGDALLSQAASDGTDLIVMGAYGRSRLRELVLGGMTRHLLRQMTVPVFMSH